MFRPSMQFYTVGIVVTNISLIVFMIYNNFDFRTMLTIGFFHFAGIALTDVRAKAIGMLIATHSKNLRKFLKEDK